MSLQALMKKIRSKLLLGLPLTAREEAVLVLYGTEAAKAILDVEAVKAARNLATQKENRFDYVD